MFLRKILVVVRSLCAPIQGTALLRRLKVSIDRSTGRRGQDGDHTPSQKQEVSADGSLFAAKDSKDGEMEVEARDLSKRWHGCNLNYVPNVLWLNINNRLDLNRTKFAGGRVAFRGAWIDSRPCLSTIPKTAAET